jgi:hypothetical protein
MAPVCGIPEAAMVSLTDLVDNCARIQPGMEVVILAHKDGLYGGVNLVDEEAVAWTDTVVKSRGANSTIIWIDEPNVLHEWRYPPIVKGALEHADVLLNFSSTLTNEEIEEFRLHMRSAHTWNIRVFALTSKLLMTEWAQTPYELVSAIRKASCKPFLTDDSPFILTDPNGTQLEGKTILPISRGRMPGVAYGKDRRETGWYCPWPEWLHTQVRCNDVEGTYIFDKMLGWWAIHIGIKPEWEKAIKVEVENSRIVDISGGEEARKVKAFLEMMEGKVGEKIWLFDTFHFGVHPNAHVEKYQCPHNLHRRLIDHSHSSNIHFHLGSAPAVEGYPYWVHITADIQHATLRVGDKLAYDNGYLCALDDPDVIEVAKKYPGRPGLPKK